MPAHLIPKQDLGHRQWEQCASIGTNLRRAAAPTRILCLPGRIGNDKRRCDIVYRATDPASAYLATLSANHARRGLAGGLEVCYEMLRAPDESAFRSLLSDIGPPRVSEVDLNPQHGVESRNRLCACKINPHSPPTGIEISRTCFLELSTKIGRG